MIKGPKYQRGFLGIVAAVIAGGSAVAGAAAGKKSSRAKRRANDAQRRINKLRNKQAKREFLQNFRQAQADAYSTAIAAGIGLESSALQGRLASQRAQADTSVAEFNRMDVLGAEITRNENKAARYDSQAQTWGAVASVASSFIAFGAGGAAPSGAAGAAGGPVSNTGIGNLKPGAGLGVI